MAGWMAASCPAACDYEMELDGVLVSRAKLVTSLFCSSTLAGVIGVRGSGSLKDGTVQFLTEMESTERAFTAAVPCVGVK